ncbi:MAG: NitT/TauT family transport system ATP-binding protein [Oleiphilaceae bacterium]|jgi:NitT/TauT family transport system ATP-binding protein
MATFTSNSEKQKQAQDSPSSRSSSDRGLIEIDKVKVVYADKNGSHTAVDETTITIKPKEFVCLLGPSGCGKSTLLSAIAGFVEPSEGCVKLDGNPIEGPGPDRGMVFQQYSLLPWKTIYQNIEMGPRLANDIEASKTATSFLEMVGLSKYRNHYPVQLSGGMQQRVGIARALATYPSVLLMDEPFGALDAQTRLVMQENLLSIWSEFGTTVVFVTHDVDEAVFLADRILVMSASPGSIIADLKNEVPRPRVQSMSTRQDFTDLKLKCLEVIRTESMRAFEMQNT